MNMRIRSEIVNKLLAISAGFLLGAALPGIASACSASLDRRHVEAADAYLDQNRPIDAFRVMYPLSQDGNGGAHQYLANMYEQGRGVKKSPFMVRHLNWMGSQYGDPEATFRAAKDFYDRGYRKDGERLAIEAKDCGHPGAIVLLVEKMKAEGRLEEGRTYLELGIDKGIPEVKFQVGEAYNTGAFGLTQDHKLAFTWYHLAAKDGFPKAMSAVAYYLARGLAGAQDDRAAIQWYHKAAMAGDVQSKTAYAWMLMNGKGADRDLDEAKRYLLAAQTEGDTNAGKFLQILSGEKKKNVAVSNRNFQGFQ